MRAVYWKELRELALVGIPLAIGAAFTGWEYSSTPGNVDQLLSLVILGGLALGITHGLLDRKRRDDLFLRHRPLPRWRLEAVRTAAGATVVVILTTVLVGFLAWGAAHYAKILSERFDIVPSSRRARDVTSGLAAYIVLLSTAIWAGFRWILSARRIWQVLALLVFAPLLLAAPVGRMEHIGGALALMALIAVACTWHVVARRRAVVTLLLCGWLLLEGATSLRLALQALQFEVYPAFGVNQEGDVKSWTVRARRVLELDLQRREVRPHDPLEWSKQMLAPFHPNAKNTFDDWLDRVPPFFEADHDWWSQRLTGQLNLCQMYRLPRDRYPPPLIWKYEHGRFVCRTRATGAVVAGFGPDGYATGSGAVEGGRFEETYRLNVRVLGDADEKRAVTLTRPGDDGWYQIRFSAASTKALDRPMPVHVAWQRIAVHFIGSATLSLKEGLTSLALVRDAGGLAVRLNEGEKVTLIRAPFDPSRETILRGWFRSTEQGLRVGTIGIVSPAHPAFATYRVRVLREDQPPIIRDIVVRPETVLEHTIAGFGGLVALARPLPLVLASYFADAPRDFEAMTSWWWLDPWFSGRRMTGWLVAALVLAALLGWWARRQALRRCASMRAVHFWTAVAVLLGPLGVIWMRLTVPWAVVEPVGDGVRAVNREATPRNDAPWPAPAAVGTEVFAR